MANPVENNLKNGTLLHGGLSIDGGLFRIVSYLSKGGFGITYLADRIALVKSVHHKTRVVLDKPERVVIKELFIERFCERKPSGEVFVSTTILQEDFKHLVRNQLREGETLHKLEHENIVKTQDLFNENNTAYIVLDYVSGQNINERIRSSGKFSKYDAINYIKQVLYALTFVHARNIAHLDISPSNIIVDEKTHKATLIDFGLSRLYSRQDHLTAETSTVIFGRKNKYTPPDANPESVKIFPKHIDTYGIIATLYYMLSGTEVPDYNVIANDPKSLSLKGKMQDNQWSESLDAIIVKGLDPNSRNRFESTDRITVALKDESEYNSVISKAQELFAKKDLNELETYVNKQLKRYPFSTTLQTFKQKFDIPAADIIQAQELRILKDKAVIAINGKRFEEALVVLHAALNIAPADSLLLYLIQDCKDKKFELYEAEFNRLLNEAKIYADKKDLKNEVALLEKALLIKEDVRVRKILDERLLVLLRDKNAAEEANLMREIMRFINVGSFGFALDNIEKLSKLNPTYPDIWTIANEVKAAKQRYFNASPAEIYIFDRGTIRPIEKKDTSSPADKPLKTGGIGDLNVLPELKKRIESDQLNTRTGKDPSSYFDLKTGKYTRFSTINSISSTLKSTEEKLHEPHRRINPQQKGKYIDNTFGRSLETNQTESKRIVPSAFINVDPKTSLKPETPVKQEPEPASILPKQTQKKPIDNPWLNWFLYSALADYYWESKGFRWFCWITFFGSVCAFIYLCRLY